MDQGSSMQEGGTVDLERVERCIVLLRELSVQVLPDSPSSIVQLGDALHLTMSRSFLIAYAVQRQAGLGHEAALRLLNKTPEAR